LTIRVARRDCALGLKKEDVDTLINLAQSVRTFGKESAKSLAKYIVYAVLTLFLLGLAAWFKK